MEPLRNQYNKVTSNKVQMAENVCVRRRADTLKMGHTVSPVPTATRLSVLSSSVRLSHGRSPHFILIYAIIAVLDCKYFT
jgi:hypothetical protein